MPDDTLKPAETAPREAVEAGAGTAPDGGGRNAAKPLPDPGRNRAGRYPRFSRVALMDLRAWVAAMFLVFGLMLSCYGLCFGRPRSQTPRTASNACPRRSTAAPTPPSELWELRAAG